MKQPEPKCPYCGTEMKIFTNTICNMLISSGYARCPECGSIGPRVVPEDVWDIEGNQLREAVKKETLRRPLQKPLTLHELLEMIGHGLEAVTFCEAKGDNQTYATIWIDDNVVDCQGITPKDNISYETYGKLWRAWAARPTDEERAAAPWEE